MCGIIGIINPTGQHIPGIGKLIPDMLAVGSIRGQHASGIMKIENGKCSWIKDAVSGWKFIQRKDFDKFMVGIGHVPFVVGHNRWATRGEITIKNAHPFECAHICLVHNGTVAQVSELYDKSLDVDSHMIAKNIAEKGIESTKNNLWGAFSLVWYDSNRKTLNFLRNQERPMWFIHTKQKAILFCSEPQMGVWCAERHGFTIEKTEELPVNTLYSYNGTNIPVIETMERVYKMPPHQYSTQDAKIVSMVDRAKLRELAKAHHVGTEFRFSLHDFDDTDTKGKFVQLFGEAPDNILIMCW